MTIEVSGKKVDDAIKEGLRTLNTTLDQVQVEILSQGGLFKKAKVRMRFGEEEKKETPPPAPAAPPERPAKAEPVKEEKHAKAEPAPAAEKPSPKNTAKKQEPQPRKERKEPETAPITPEIVQAAETFLNDVLRLMDVTAELKTQQSGKELKIDIITDNSAVIGYRGETLDALEYLCSLTAGKGDERFVKVRLDCNDYRSKREESLTALAKRMADKCANTGKKVTLEPMSSAHRRIIHSALGEDERVFTKSEGKDPNRRIVILPKRK